MDFKSLSSNQQFALNVFVPLLYLLPLLVVYFSPKDFGFGFRKVVYLGLSLGALGVILWILSMLHLGKSLAVLPGAEVLVTRGVYRYLRHPIYWGIFLTLFGLFLACGSVFGLVYLIVVVLPLNLYRAREENKALLQRFGASYLAWREKTWF